MPKKINKNMSNAEKMKIVRSYKKTNMKGDGLKEIAGKVYNFGKNVYNAVSDANEQLKKKKYAGRLVQALPEVAQIPLVGNYIKTAAELGYGKKQKIIKGMGMQTPTIYGTV